MAWLESAAAFSKADLIQRLAKRAGRYNVVITGRLVDRWIEQALLAAGERNGNVGRRPQYAYRARHYRRALQIARLYGDGVKDRDAILVQLFVHGYGTAPQEVREPLWKEYRKAAAKILAPIRGDYSHRPSGLSEGRRQRLRNHLGQLDPRIEKAGFTLATDDLLGLFRLTVAPEGLVGKADPPMTSSPGLAVAMPLVWPMMLKVLPTFLALDPDFPNPIEAALIAACDDEFYEAADALNCIRALFAIFDQFPVLALFGGNSGGLPGRFVSRSLLAREWCAASLAMMIYLLVKYGRNDVSAGAQ